MRSLESIGVRWRSSMSRELLPVIYVTLAVAVVRRHHAPRRPGVKHQVELASRWCPAARDHWRPDLARLTSGNSEDPAIGAETVRCGEKYLYVFKGARSAPDPAGHQSWQSVTRGMRRLPLLGPPGRGGVGARPVPAARLTRPSPADPPHHHADGSHLPRRSEAGLIR